MATTAPAPSLPEPLPAPAAAPASGVVARAAGGPTLLDLLRASTDRHARRPALLIKPGFRTRVWTHGDLAEMAPKVARVLADAGLAKGDRVVIWAVNRPEWGLAYLGALHAGIERRAPTVARRSGAGLRRADPLPLGNAA